MAETLDSTPLSQPAAPQLDLPPKSVEEEATRRQRLARVTDLAIPALTACIFIAGLVAVPGFGSGDNLSTLMREASFIGIVALGMTLVVMSGNYVDLSVGAQVGIAAVCAIALQPQGLVLALLIGLGFCLVVGLINGVLTGYLQANPVIVTLGIGAASLALLNEITKGAIYSGQNAGFANFAKGSLGPVPVSFVAFLVVACCIGVLLGRMGYGRRLRAVGSNRSVARLSGVSPGRIVLIAFLVTAACCWASGVLLSGFVNTANAGIASEFSFEALAAVVVGGTALSGGRGGARQTVIGALLIAIIANLLVVAGLSFDWQQLIKGGVIVSAVAFDAASRRFGAR